MSNPKMSNAKMSNRVLIRTVPGESEIAINTIILTCSSVFPLGFLAQWVVTERTLCTVVSRKYAPPFATLTLVQSARGAYTRDATFSFAITPPPPGLDGETFSGFVDACFVLALQFDHGNLQTDSLLQAVRVRGRQFQFNSRQPS